MTPLTPPQTLPLKICEWCGGDVFEVRVVRSLDDLTKYRWELIDAVPSVADDDLATLIRVPRSRTGGHVNFVMTCPDDWRYLDQFRELLYCLHRRTCENRHLWTGPKTIVKRLRDRDEEAKAWESMNPELVESRYGMMKS